MASRCLISGCQLLSSRMAKTSQLAQFRYCAPFITNRSQRSGVDSREDERQSLTALSERPERIVLYTYSHDAMCDSCLSA